MNIVAYGNSLTGAGFGGTCWPTQAASLVGAQDSITNVGTANQYTDQMLSNFLTDVHPSFVASKLNVCVWWESIDSIDDHAITPAQELVKIKQAVDLCHSKGWYIIVAPALPCKDPPSLQSDRDSFASSLRANYQGADEFYDCASEALLQNPDDATYFADAGGSPSVHLTTAGYAIIAAGFSAALLRLAAKR